MVSYCRCEAVLDDYQDEVYDGVIAENESRNEAVRLGSSIPRILSAIKFREDIG